MSSNPRFKRLFEPGQIGNMTVKNRIVMSSMQMKHATEDGFVTESMKDYYEDRAKGGVGLIIVEAASVDFPQGGGLRILRVDNDKTIDGLASLAEVIHRHDAKAVLHVFHLGPACNRNFVGMQPVAASPLGRPPDYSHPAYSDYRSYGVPRELLVSEIKDIVASFAKAAERAKKAGYDGIEIGAGHRYLINSFISPVWNRRQDSYGGELGNRARFLLEIIWSMRELVGDDYPVWCKINGEERDIDGGITVEMAQELARMLESAGTNAISVTSMYPHSPEYLPAFNVKQAAEIKRVVKIPVIVVGRIEPELGEKILRQKKADFICIGRGLVADAELANKLASGRLEDINRCTYCCSCLASKSPVCTVNAARLEEGREYQLKPVKKPRQVIVVGGGPSGMEAARVAALRGHQVTLYEKARRLGGQLALASLLREENERIIRYLVIQMKKAGVKVELGKEVDLALIDKLKPDVVLLATGASSTLPEIPGIDVDSVLSASDIQAMMAGHLKRAGTKGPVSRRRYLWYLGIIFLRVFGPSAMRRLLRFWAPFGRRIIVVGLGLPGVEIADFLAQRGKEVTIVGTHEQLFPEPPMPVLKLFFEQRIAENGVTMVNAEKYEWITHRGLTITNKLGYLQTIKGDTVLFAADYKPNTKLSEVLAGTSYEVHQVGDCVAPVGILEAIRDGSRVGRAI